MLKKFLEEQAQDWYNFLVVSNRAQVTVKKYMHNVKIFINFLIINYPNLSLNQIIRQRCLAQDFFSYLVKERQITHRSSALYASSINGFLMFLYNYSRVDYCLQLEIPKYSHCLPRAINQENLEEIITNFNQGNMYNYKQKWYEYRDLLIICLLYSSGMRVSELLSLNNSDFLKEHGLICIKGKGGKFRNIELFEVIRTLYNNYIDSLPPVFKNLTKQNLLWISNTGKRLSDRYIRILMQKIREHHKLPSSASPHALRHSFASHLINQNTNIRTVKDLLGHQNLSSTQIYLKLNINKLKLEYFAKHPRSIEGKN